MRGDGNDTEADNCRAFVAPKLVDVGRVAAPHVIGERRGFTSGRLSNGLV